MITVKSSLFLLLAVCILACVTFLVGPANADQIIRIFQYDDNNQLTQVRYGNGDRIDYSYDPAGNQTAIVSTLIPSSQGDLNRDGVVDLEDAILSLQVLAGIPIEGLDPNAELEDPGSQIGFVEAIHVLQSVDK